MANQETERLLIDIEVNADQALQDATKTAEAIKVVREETERLKKENEALAKAGDKNSETYKKNAELIQLNEAELKNLSSELRNSQKVLQANQNSTEGTTGAYQRLSQQYAVAAQRAKDLATVHGVNSVEAKRAADAAKWMSDRLKEVDASVGQNQRNVGNYPKVFDLSNTSMGRFAESIKDFAGTATSVGGVAGNAFAGIKAQAISLGKAFLTPPIGLIVIILGAIMLAAKKVADAFKKNDDAATKLEQAFAQFKPVAEAISWIFDKIALVIANLVLGFSKMATAILNLIPAYKKSASAAEQLVLSQDKLEDTEREYVVKSAERNKEIARLKKEAVNTQKYTDKEIAEMLKKADELALKNFEDDKKRKAEALRIIIAKAKQEKDTSDATKDKIAQARAAMLQAEESYFSETLRLATKTNAAAERIESERLAKEEEAREKRKEAEAKAREKRDKAREAELKKMELDLQISQAKEKEVTVAGAMATFEAEKKIRDKKVAYGKMTNEEKILDEINSQKKLYDVIKIDAEKKLAEQIKNAKLSLDIDGLKNQEKYAGVEKSLELEKQLADKKLKKEYEISLLSIQGAKDEADQKKIIDQKFKTDKALSDAEFAEKSRALKQQALQSDFEAEMVIAQGNLDAEHALRLQDLDRQREAELAAAEKTGANKLLIEQKYAKLERELELAKVQAKLSMVSGFLGNVKGLFKEGSKAAKGVASAQVAVDTISGAIAAFKSMAGIPVVGTALGAVAAAGVTLSGAKAIKDIWKVKDDGVTSVPSQNINVGTAASMAAQSVTGSLVQRSTQPTQESQVQNGVSNAMSENPQQPVLVIDNVTDAINRKSEAKVVNGL